MSDITSLWRLAVIIGSTREGRFGPTVANWFKGQADQHDDMEVDLIDLADTEMPTAHPGWGTAHTPSVALLGERLARADAFVIVTPEYNHSYPASLKQAIDLYTNQWQAKPVAFVSYGGMGGGLRSVQALRPIFIELHAVPVREQVSFHNAASLFDTDGELKDAVGANGAAKKLLDNLSWWAQALSNARKLRPYGA